MGWFRNNNNNNNENSSSSSSSSSLLTSWQVSALATVALPLFFFLVSGIFSQDGGGEEGGWWSNFWNNDEERGGWWWWWQNDHQEEQRGNGGAALGFVYCWSLVLFGVLVWRGSKVLEKKKDYRALFAVLVVFANLAFLCWILVAGSGVRSSSCTLKVNKISFCRLCSDTIFSVLNANTARRRGSCRTRMDEQILVRRDIDVRLLDHFCRCLCHHSVRKGQEGKGLTVWK